MTFGGFYRGRRVLVTGHTGFKGSWLAHWLLSLGAEVHGVALAPATEEALFTALNLAPRLQHRLLDVRDADALTAAVAEIRPEVVLHLAAQSLVRPSYRDARGTWETNVGGTVNLLEAMRAVPGIAACVVVTSDKCYANREQGAGYREDDPLGGHDPYSASKAAMEIVTASYRQSFFAGTPLRIATARAGNVIGGGDWADERVITEFLATIGAGRPLALRHPLAVRPWQHVLEPLNGYLTLAQALYTEGPKHAQAWNFGPYEFSDRSVGWIVERLHSLWGNPVAWEPDTGLNPHEAGYLKVDYSMARAVLGWSPKLDLDTTLQWIVDWTLAHRDGDAMREMTLAQIRGFRSLPDYQPSSQNERVGQSLYSMPS